MNAQQRADMIEKIIDLKEEHNWSDFATEVDIAESRASFMEKLVNLIPSGSDPEPEPPCERELPETTWMRLMFPVSEDTSNESLLRTSARLALMKAAGMPLHENPCDGMIAFRHDGRLCAIIAKEFNIREFVETLATSDGSLLRAFRAEIDELLNSPEKRTAAIRKHGVQELPEEDLDDTD